MEDDVTARIEISYEVRDANLYPISIGKITGDLKAIQPVMENAVLRADLIADMKKKVPANAVPITWRFILEGTF